MRKTQQKTINRAMKLQLSEDKVSYLMREDKPVWFYSDVLTLLMIYHDEDLPVIDKLYNWILSAYKRKEWQKTFSSISFIIQRADYNQYQISASDINRMLTSETASPENISHILSFMSYGLTFTQAAESCDEFLLYNKSRAYKEIITLRDEAKHQPYEYSLKKEYANYIAEKQYCDGWQLRLIEKFLKYNISLEEAVKIGFSRDALKHYLLTKNFAFLEEKYFKGEFSFVDEFWLDEDSKVALENMKPYVPVDNQITINGRVVKMKMQFSGVDSINIKFSLYSKMCLVANRGDAWLTSTDLKQETEFVWFMSKGFFRISNGRWIPMLVKDIPHFCQLYDYPFIDLWNGLYDCLVKDSLVLKDIKQYTGPSYYDYSIRKSLPPITLNECVGIHKKNELFHAKYKYGNLLNWNKTNMLLGYFIYKAKDLVDKQQIGKLVAIKDIPEFQDEEYLIDLCQEKSLKEAFLRDILMYSLDKSTYWQHKNGTTATELEVWQVINDYINMCRRMKIKINLRFKSAKKLRDAHDRLTKKYQSKFVPEVVVPENSRFNHLRELLPEAFEWIKNKKRLIAEGIHMHHCVASYASLINYDQCAIYSFYDANSKEPYTIEFTQDDNRDYQIRQFQSVGNNGCPRKLFEYVNRFLNADRKMDSTSLTIDF